MKDNKAFFKLLNEANELEKAYDFISNLIDIDIEIGGDDIGMLLEGRTAIHNTMIEKMEARRYV